MVSVHVRVLETFVEEMVIANIITDSNSTYFLGVIKIQHNKKK